MIELTEEQSRQVAQSPGEPVTLIDPITRAIYVLIKADTYERLRPFLEEGLDMGQVAVLVERAMREEDENDPTLEFYQRKYGNER